MKTSSSLESTPTLAHYRDSKFTQHDGSTSKHPTTNRRRRTEKQLTSSRRLPDNVSFSEGALLEPLSVVMHGIERARLSLGHGAVICGAGPIGLIALAAARASGAHPLCITDLNASRLEFAKKYVPSCQTYLVDPTLSGQENAQRLRKLFGDQEYVAPSVVSPFLVEGLLAQFCFADNLTDSGMYGCGKLGRDGRIHC